MITVTIKQASGFGETSDQRDVMCLGEKIATSDDPLFAAARILYNRGVPPQTKLIIQRPHQRDLHTTVGEHAKLGNADHGAYPKPNLGRYEPFIKRAGLA